MAEPRLFSLPDWFRSIRRKIRTGFLGEQKKPLKVGLPEKKTGSLEPILFGPG